MQLELVHGLSLRVLVSNKVDVGVPLVAHHLATSEAADWNDHAGQRKWRATRLRCSRLWGSKASKLRKAATTVAAGSVAHDERALRIRLKLMREKAE